MRAQKLSFVYTTTATIQAAEQLAEQAVLQKWAACVNIIPGAISVYEWEGKLEKSQECLLLFKTSTAKALELQDWIMAHHPYATPAILSGSIHTSEAFYSYVQSVLC